MEFFEELFQALKNDDIKAFRSCMETTNCGSLRLGRFPVLSVMYLYKATRLLRVYEKGFLKHNSWRDVGEPMEIAAKFRSVAGKCLRFYLNETVSPVEMLLLLNRDFKLKRVFSQAHVTAPVKQRLKDIYFVKWGLQADFVRNTIVLEHRPMTRAEKLHWLNCTLCVVLCVALIVGTPFVVNAFAPFISDGNGAIVVSKWEQIRFSSDKTYALGNDVTVPENFFVEEMNCTLNGNNHTVTVQGNGVFGDINGALKDIVFETNGSPVAEKVALGAVVDRVTVYAVVNMQTDKAIGFFANDNFGTVNNVVLNVTGNLSAVAPQQEEPTDDAVSFNCGGIVARNNYTVQGNNYDEAKVLNCSANYDNFTLQGQLQANATFGGIVGVNDGYVQDCQTSGAIVANTFDVAGICAENNYALFNDVNRANLSQSTDVVEWSPFVAGIVLNNFLGGVQGCYNYGAITSVSTAVATDEEHSPTVYAAGIVNRAYGSVQKSANRGVIRAESNGAVYVGGIASESCYLTKECFSDGSIEVIGDVCYVGGIWGLSFGWEYNEAHLYLGNIERCISNCEISVTKKSSDSFVAVGGIVGLAQEWQITYVDTGEIVYRCGKVLTCYFTGKLQADSDAYAGAIAGVVGKLVYLDSETSTSPHFQNNVYVDGCGVDVASGAALTRDDHNYERIKDVGAQVATASEIENDKTYKEIMKIFA